MSIGAQDYIDQLLVQKYSQQQVDNHNEDSLISKIDANDMMDAMNNCANSQRMMLNLNYRLTNICYGIVAKGAVYKPINVA